MITEKKMPQDVISIRDLESGTVFYGNGTAAHNLFLKIDDGDLEYCNNKEEVRKDPDIEENYAYVLAINLSGSGFYHCHMSESDLLIPESNIIEDGQLLKYETNK